jgi:ribosomal protein L12E/L44/L45/RPP1/RPP2
MDATPVTRLLIKTLHTLDEEIAEAEAKVAALTLERQGVEAVLKRFGETSTAAPATTTGPAATKEAVSSNGRPEEPAGQAGQPTLTSRVLNLLVNGGRPMSIEEIAKRLDLDITQARSATAYLKRKGEVHNVKRGLWQAGTPTDAETAPASTGAVSVPNHSIMEGGGADGTDADRVRDHHSLWQAEDRDQGRGAPVVGG